MPWTIILAKPVQKQAAGIPASDRAKIIAALRGMVVDPFAGDVLKLEGGERRWRRRVGSYRIFFTVDIGAKTVAVSAILRRTSSTY
jgi:mRNA-degrading endonuclease RelE of RelBE toxin-antitoxin system